MPEYLIIMLQVCDIKVQRHIEDEQNHLLARAMKAMTKRRQTSLIMMEYKDQLYRKGKKR
jgi:hypothetical protein